MAKKEILNNEALTVRVDEDGPIEAVLDSTERALDVLEGKIETIENITEKAVTVTKNNPYLIAGALLLGIGIGGAIAYKIVEKRLAKKFDEELTEQIAAAKEFHSKVNKEGVFESPESAVQALVPPEVVTAVQEYQGRDRHVPYDKPGEISDPRPPIVVEAETVEVTKNVFTEAKKSKEPTEEKHDPRDWDYNAEIADRELNPDQPYTISFEEFNENAPDNEQTTLSYYTEDDTLVDSQDKPIDNTEYTVGDDNLTRFGHGSHDPNVVYVRNDKTGMDFEIVRVRGSYQKEVFGTEPDALQHSRRGTRRGWRADE